MISRISHISSQVTLGWNLTEAPAKEKGRKLVYNAS